MVIATLKEVKDNENRVGLTPTGAGELIRAGHRVLVQTEAGVGASFDDGEYVQEGAEMMDSPEEICSTADIIVKVKEPVEKEYPLLERLAGKTLFTYLHLSGVDPKLTHELMRNNITAIAYETVQDSAGKLPLLAPMSEVAGVLAVQFGAQYLQKKYGGRGISLGMIHNTEQANVVIVGGGFVGETAAKTAAGMGSKVTVFDINDAAIERLRKNLREYLGDNLYGNVEVLKTEPEIFAQKLHDAHLVIGAVLVPGARAPRVLREEDVRHIRRGSVIVDVSIDQGGCVWGAHSTTHSDPIYTIDGKIFCCVTNMPGQVPRQSTQALTSATFPYLKEMASRGITNYIRESLQGDKGFARGVNVFRGKIAYKSVAEDLGMMDQYMDLEQLMVAIPIEPVYAG